MNIDLVVNQANQAYQQKKYLDAAKFFQEAAKIYQDNGNETGYAEMLNNASVAYLQAGNAQSAYDIVKGTDLIFEKNNMLDKQGFALANEAAALEELGNLQEALQKYQKASDLLKMAGLNDNRAFVLKRISSIQIKQGKQLEALGSMHSALENADKLSGREKTLKKLTNWVVKLIQRN